MSLSNHPRAYGTAAIAIAFVVGVLATLGFKDFYPDLERRYQESRRKKKKNSGGGARRSRTWDSDSSTSRRRSSFFWGGGDPVQLEDHEGQTSSNFVQGIEESIGNTPLIKIKSLSAATGRTILAKAEFLNAAGNSPKDRVALNMIRRAEAAGQLVPGRGDTIYEGTSGSTGISLAALARAMGYRAHIIMPDDQAVEKSDLLRRLGAEVERVPVTSAVDAAYFVNLARARAEEHTRRSREDSGGDGSRGFFTDQFESPSNWEAHFKTTGPEIFDQTAGRVDAFVAGAGTGGTIAGVAKYLKEEAKLDDVKIVLADPQGSGLYNKVRHGVCYSSTEKEGTRRRSQVDTMVEGIGLNRLTHNFTVGYDVGIDDAVRVTDEQACKMARWLVENDGIFCGSSTAVNCVAAVVTAMSLPEDSLVVTVLCDSGTRHLSKFWKKVADLGLEDEPKPDDLFELLSIKQSPELHFDRGIHLPWVESKS